MCGLVITTSSDNACPNCEGTMIQELTMKHDVTAEQIDKLKDADDREGLRDASASVLERCESCGYKIEAG